MTSSPISKAYAALDPSPAGDSRDALIERLAKALEPFAKEAGKFDPVENDDHFLTWGTTFTVGDLRAARAALSAKEQP